MGIVQNYGGLLATRLCLGIAGMIAKYSKGRETHHTNNLLQRPACTPVLPTTLLCGTLATALNSDKPCSSAPPVLPVHSPDFWPMVSL